MVFRQSENVAEFAGEPLEVDRLDEASGHVKCQP